MALRPRPSPRMRLLFLSGLAAALLTSVLFDALSRQAFGTFARGW